MEERKYEITESTIEVNGKILHQIVSLKDFTTNNDTKISKGDKGGWVESETNLSQKGYSWIFENGIVYNAIITGNATIGEINNNVAVVIGIPITISDNIEIKGYGNILPTKECYSNNETSNVITFDKKKRITVDVSKYTDKYQFTDNVIDIINKTNIPIDQMIKLQTKVGLYLAASDDTCDAVFKALYKAVDEWVQLYDVQNEYKFARDCLFIFSELGSRNVTQKDIDLILNTNPAYAWPTYVGLVKVI